MEAEKVIGNVRIPNAATQTSHGDNSAIDVMKTSPAMAVVVVASQVNLVQLKVGVNESLAHQA